MQHAEHRTSPPLVSALEAMPHYVPPTPATAPRPGENLFGSPQFVHPLFHPEIHPEIHPQIIGRNHQKSLQIIRSHEKRVSNSSKKNTKQPIFALIPTHGSPRQDRHHHGRTTSQILRPWCCDTKPCRGKDQGRHTLQGTNISPPKRALLSRWSSFSQGGIC